MFQCKKANWFNEEMFGYNVLSFQFLDLAYVVNVFYVADSFSFGKGG